MKILRFIRKPYTSLALNAAYAVGNCVFGFISRSWWLITVGAYYAVLAVTRFSVLQIRRKANGDTETERFARRFTGILLILLSLCIAGINVLAVVESRGTDFHEIAMITVATYTFAKITLACIGMAKAKQTVSPTAQTLRNVSLAEACVSVYTMQRSMLVSFPGMEEAGIVLLNILTGTAVWIIVLLLGINLIGGKRVEMAKSKIVKANGKIAEVVTDGYKKIEKGVVDGYKKIEKGVVDGYGKIEDKFVETYLTKDGETVEEAKKRLKNTK